MKIAIFGGTGKAGHYLVQKALNAGHEVVALARNPAKLTITHDKLKVITGELADRACVSETIAGTDAVMSVLGVNNNNPERVMTQGYNNILSAMQEHGVTRLILSCGAVVYDPLDKPVFLDRMLHKMIRAVRNNLVEDMRQAVDNIRASDRDWTIVRVPYLREMPAKGNLKVGYLGDINPVIAREDMVNFMLEQLTSEAYSRKAPTISN